MDLAFITFTTVMFVLFVFCLMLLNRYWEKKQDKIDRENNRRANWDKDYHNSYNRKTFGNYFKDYENN